MVQFGCSLNAVDRTAIELQSIAVVVDLQFYCNRVNYIQTAPELQFAVGLQLKCGPSVWSISVCHCRSGMKGKLMHGITVSPHGKQRTINIFDAY